MPLFTNDAIVLGILMSLLAFVFYTSHSENSFWKKFYTYVPALLLCYFLPALFNWPLGIIDGETSKLYNPVTSRYLLPASLIFLCLSIDLKGILNLGPKALIMFFTATIGIVIGGPIAILLLGYIAPNITEVAGDEPMWKGLSTVAGSWIGGGGNQTAMKEIFQVSDKLFSAMVVIDVVVANIWMAFILYGAGITKKIDKWFRADTTAIEDLKSRVADYQASIARVPTLNDYMQIMAVGFGGTALAHWGAEWIGPVMENINEQSKLFVGEGGIALYPNGKLVEWGLSSLMSKFFWLIVIATTIGLGLSFTKVRKLEGAGASKIGSLFIYILVASIGMKMNIGEVGENLSAFAIGLVWMSVHVILLLSVGKLIRAPFFFTAVGSQANVGGAASAPVVASAFSPALAPVGVLMAVLGYALGTYGALICAYLMQWAS